ncbi:MAG: hydantoinase/oxoprolinase N-terminal domain-containing protein, partial [Thermaerobacter sp.]
MLRVGIDVGGTNTDAVLMEGDRVVAKVKVPGTDDL